MNNEEPLLIEAPKKKGRPVGSSPKKKLGPDEINKAKIMFVAGKSIPEIGKEMGLTSLNTLYNHMKKGGWEEEKDKFFKESSETQLSSILSSSLAETELVLMDLKSIRDRSIESIDTKEVSPRKYSEAANAYIDAVNISMKIRAEALQLSFIMELGKVLKEEIRDPLPPANELLLKISGRLRELFKLRQKELISAPK